MSLLATPSEFPLLVVLNPYAGRRQGRVAYENQVLAALKTPGIPSKLFETTCQGHAQTYFKDNIQQILGDLCQSLAPSIGNTSDTTNDADAGHTASASDSQQEAFRPTTATFRIMVLGGDGTIHEIVNGILEGLKGSAFVSDEFRPKIEFSIIPTGTGNAIATSLGITNVQDALDRFLAGASTPLRVIQVSTVSTTVNPDEPSGSKNWEVRLYTVVVNSFGLHCATVQDSEEFRALGNARFKIAALKNIILLKQYEARVDLFGPIQRYDRVLQELVSAAASNDINTGTTTEPEISASSGSDPSLTLLGPFTYLMLSKQAFLEPGFKPTPFAKTSDEWLDILAVENVGRGQILQVLGGATNNGLHIAHEKVEYYKAKAVELETPEKGRLCVDGEFLNVEGGAQGRVRFEVVPDPNLQLFH
ncbi:ATP-NAD kinase-like domain-containing protein, partial [Dissophora ornata]